ncbi:hypothetical protein ACYSNR_00895 [Enterococcus sp. LJL128]
MNETETRTVAEILKIKEAMAEAEKDSTPYLAMNEEDELIVNGDANKTEIKSNDYTISFLLYEDQLADFPYQDAAVIEVSGRYRAVVTLKDKRITPRMNTSLVKYFMELNPFFSEFLPDGSIERASDTVLTERILLAGDQLYLPLYNIVATMLGIDDYYGEYMEQMSVFETFLEILYNHPELVNESDVFFGLPIEKLSALAKEIK